MSKVYTAAVIGAGAGGTLSIKALAASERYELVAVSDLRADVRADIASAYGVPTFATYQELFAAIPVDVVCVSTWPPSHREIALAALNLPLTGILVEKPLGDTAAAGRDILESIRARGLPMAVPHGLLAAPHSLEIIQRVQQGEIGQLRLLEIESDKWDIINAGIHWLNFFVTIVQREPMRYVMSLSDTSTCTYRDGMQVETLAMTYAETQSGIRVVMQTGDYVRILPTGHDHLFRLVGTAGVIEFWGWESRYWLMNAAHPTGNLVEVPNPPRSKHQIHLENMAGQMDVGQPDYAIAESSLMALEICEGAYLSHAHRCLVKLPLSEFVPPTASDWQPGKPYAGVGGGRDGRKLPNKDWTMESSL